MDGYIIVIYFTIYENDFVLFLLIGMFKWQHFSMDAIQNGYFLVKNGVQLNFTTLRTEESSRFKEV